MGNYNLLDCSIMGISDYLKSEKYKLPKWMNELEAKAYKLGFERCKNQCNLQHTGKKS